MLERNISRHDIINCIMYGEIIEDYPLEKENTSELSYPSCLILWVNILKDDVFHIVVGYNGRRMIIISAYHPNEEHWEPDYKTRRK